MVEPATEKKRDLHLFALFLFVCVYVVGTTQAFGTQKKTLRNYKRKYEKMSEKKTIMCLKASEREIETHVLRKLDLIVSCISCK